MHYAPSHLKLGLQLAVSTLSAGALAAVGAALGPGLLPTIRAASPGPCTSVTLNGPTDSPAGQAVPLAAAAMCGTPPEFAFFSRPGQASAWTLVRGWGGPDFVAPGGASGPAQFLVWATDGSLTVPQVQQAMGVEFGTTAQPACTSVTLTSTPPSPLPGKVISFQAHATCPPSVVVRYSYFTRPSPSSPWTLQAAWIGPSWTWTAPALPGAYQVLAWASDGPTTVPQVQSSTEVYDGVPSTCTALSLQANPATTAPGQSVTVSANSTCAPGSNPEYSYFVGPTSSGPWTLKAAWIGSSWTWQPSSSIGAKYVLVWASNGPYTVPQVQASVLTTAAVPTTCTGLTLATSPAGSAISGGTVTISASSTCPANSTPEYSYFIGPSSSGPWALQAAWVGPTWTWQTSGKPAGTYYVLAWVSDGPYTVPQFQTSTAFQLSSAAPTTPTDPSPTSGSPTGASGPTSDPQTNLSSSFMASCWQAGYASLTCEQVEIANIDSALASEGLGPLVWPSALYSLPLAQQLFIVTNEERLARGLPPISGMATEADANALAGAQAAQDPQSQQLPGVIASFGNWAEDYGPLASDFDWMYNDGPGSFNVDCSSSGSAGCWVHRNDILANTAAAPLIAPGGYVWAAGAACVPNTSMTFLSNCDLEYALVPAASLSYDFTWAQALAEGAGAPTP